MKVVRVSAAAARDLAGMDTRIRSELHGVQKLLFNASFCNPSRSQDGLFFVPCGLRNGPDTKVPRTFEKSTDCVHLIRAKKNRGDLEFSLNLLPFTKNLLVNFVIGTWVKNQKYF